VSHMHYYAFGLPLVAGLWLQGLANRPGQIWPGWQSTAPLAVWAIATAIPLFDGAMCEALRHRGLGVVASLGLLAVGVARLGWNTQVVEKLVLIPFLARRQAA